MLASKTGLILEGLRQRRIQEEVDYETASKKSSEFTQEILKKYPGLKDIKLFIFPYPAQGDIDVSVGSGGGTIRARVKNGMDLVDKKDVAKVISALEREAKKVAKKPLEWEKETIAKFSTAIGKSIEVNTKLPDVKKTKLTTVKAVIKFIDMYVAPVLDENTPNDITVQIDKTPAAVVKLLQKAITDAGYEPSVSQGVVSYQATKSVSIELRPYKSDSGKCVDIEIYEVR